MNEGSKALVAMIRKLEDILVGHGVTLNVDLGGLAWDARAHSFRYGGKTLLEWVGGASPPDPARLATDLTKLVTQAIETQKAYENTAQLAAVELAKYVANVGWYKPELINPVEGVNPNGTY